MDKLHLKILAVLLLFIGEAFSIYADMSGARAYITVPFLAALLKPFLITAFGAGFLIAGYILGFKAFKNIWIVSATSITSVLILEAVLAVIIFGQLPTTGAAIGFVLGVAGFIATMW